MKFIITNAPILQQIYEWGKFLLDIKVSSKLVVNYSYELQSYSNVQLLL